MTSLLENLSTREPSPFADTCTAALLALAGLVAGPVSLPGRLGAKLDVKAAILAFVVPQCLCFAGKQVKKICSFLVAQAKGGATKCGFVLASIEVATQYLWRVIGRLRSNHLGSP